MPKPDQDVLVKLDPEDIDAFAKAVVEKLAAAAPAIAPAPAGAGAAVPDLPAPALEIARELISMPKHPERVNEKIHELAHALTAEGLL